MYGRPRAKALFAIALAGSLMSVASPVAAASDPSSLVWSPTTAPGSYDFGTVDGSSGQSASMTFTLANTGDRSSGTVEVGLSGSSAFTVTSDACSDAALPGGRSCQVSIEFAPGAAGLETATLTATGEHASAALDLTGSGGITVCASGCDYASVQAAIDAAPSGTTVHVDAGAYTGQISIAKDVTIAGAGAGQTTFTGTAPVVTVATGVTATISGVTVSGATGGLLGGGIHNEGTLALSSCVVSGNSASSGGGIYNATGASVTLTDCTVDGNSASSGGGIYSIGGATVSLIGTSVTSNTATLNGGGIANVSASVQALDSAVSGNTAGSQGGGVYSTSGTLSVTGGGVSSNSANVGGGVYNLGGSLALSGGTLSGNKAAFGGGVFNSNLGSATLSTETVAANSATYYGGGVYTASGTTLSVTGSSLTGNAAGVDGGAVYKAGTITGTFSGDTFSGNTPDDCGPTTC